MRFQSGWKLATAAAGTMGSNTLLSCLQRTIRCGGTLPANWQLQLYSSRPSRARKSYQHMLGKFIEAEGSIGPIMWSTCCNFIYSSNKKRSRFSPLKSGWTFRSRQLSVSFYLRQLTTGLIDGIWLHFNCIAVTCINLSFYRRICKRTVLHLKEDEITDPSQLNLGIIQNTWKRYRPQESNYPWCTQDDKLHHKTIIYSKQNNSCNIYWPIKGI